MHISLRIIIAALSVLGFYFCLKTLASLIFTSKQIFAAVIIDDLKQIKDLDFLLEDASSALFATKGRRLAILVPSEVWSICDENDRSRAKSISDEFGAKIYFV